MAIVVHNSGSNITTLANGTQVTNCALKIAAVPERYLVFNIAMRSNTNSVNAGTVFWQPAGTTTGQEALTFLGAATCTGTNDSTLAPISDALRVEQWGLLNPTASTATTSRVVFTTNAAVKGAYSATCWQGVDQTTPYTGYPAVPTNFASGRGTTRTSVAGETTAVSVTTATGDTVVDVFASDVALSTNNFNTLNDRIVTGRIHITGGSAPSYIRMGTSAEVATGTSTSIQWKSYTGTTTSFNSGQSGRTYVHAGFPLKPSTSVAPYWVMPPNEIVAVGGTTAAALRFNSIADWGTAGHFSLHQTIGPSETGTATNILSKQFTARTTVAITGASTYAGSCSLGDVAFYRMAGGDGASALGTGSVLIYIPSSAAADDIILISVYTEAAAITVSAATFASAGSPTATQIAANATAQLNHTVLWKRLTAADVTASTITVTFSATPAWRSVMATIYRGCVTSGTPYVTAGDGTFTTNTGTSADVTVTGVTTPAADHTVVMFGAKYINALWAPPVGSTAVGEQGEFFNQWVGDISRPTAGAVSNQTITANNAANTWSAMAITLIPAVGNATLTRSAARAFVAIASDVTRPGSTYNRTGSRAFVAISSTVSRAGSTWRRTGARAFVAISSLASRRVTFNRRATRAFVAISSTTSRAGSTWRRTGARAFVPISSLASRFLNVGSVVFTRTAARAFVAISSTASRAGSTTRKSASRAFVAISSTVSKAGGTHRRTASRSFVTIASLTSRAGSTYRRTVTRNGVSITSVVSQSITPGAGIAFFAFGTYPVLRTYTAAQFVSATLYLEVTMRGTSVAYARLVDVTGQADPGAPNVGTVVAGSQVQTTAPHGTVQRVRSTAFTLTDGSLYRVEVGRTSGFQSTLVSADLVVRT